LENTCVVIEDHETDSDGDGIIDAIDVCMNISDPNQEDSGSRDSSEPDGIGDACRLPANIRAPAANRRILVGQSVRFTSIVTEVPFIPNLVYLWDFDGGAANSTDPNPGDVVFATPGIFTVGLSVTDNDGAGATFGPDTRVVFVEGLDPVVDAGGPYFGVEGELLAMTASATPLAGVITAFDWTFGDGQVGSGNPTSNTYAQQGTYPVEVTVTDSGLRTGSDTTSAFVADTEPTADFSFGPGATELELEFTDTSTAYDGIVGWEWKFNDGSAGSSAQNPLHLFPAAGLYPVMLTVTDGDGSVDSIMFDVDVGVHPEPGDILVGNEFGSGLNTLIQVDPNTGAQEVLGSGGTLDSTIDIEVESNGMILLLDEGDNTGGAGEAILRFHPRTKAVQIVTQESWPGSLLDHPNDLALDPNGNILVADSGSLGEAADGKVIRVDPSNGTEDLVSSGGNLVDPWGITVAPNGDIFVADASGVISIDPDSGTQKIVSSGPAGTGIAIEDDGRILLAAGDLIRVDSTQDPNANRAVLVAAGPSFSGAFDLALAENRDIYTVQGGLGDGAVYRVDPNTGDTKLVSQGSFFDGAISIAIYSNRDCPPGCAETSDADGDLICDACDNCPFFPNPGQSGNSDGDLLCDEEDPCKFFTNTWPLVISGFSGIPDECLCGDFDGDGFHSATDAAAINDCAAFVRLDCVSERDEVSEPIDGFYSATDADLVNRVAAFLDPAYTLKCGLRPEGTCGGETGVSCF
jgi:PKD repeat protein/streptogramin lyase